MPAAAAVDVDAPAAELEDVADDDAADPNLLAVEDELAPVPHLLPPLLVADAAEALVLDAPLALEAWFLSFQAGIAAAAAGCDADAGVAAAEPDGRPDGLRAAADGPHLVAAVGAGAGAGCISSGGGGAETRLVGAGGATRAGIPGFDTTLLLAAVVML